LEKPLNIKKLKCFRAVVIHGSLVAAANVMNLSQPATSRLISTLEDELKLKLFKREKRRLVLTPEGKEFYRETEKILSNLDDLPRIVQEIKALESVSPAQMAEHDIIALAPGLRPRFQMEEIFNAAGVALDCKIETTSSVLACQMVVEGLGVTIIDRLAALAVDQSRFCLRPLSPNYRLQFVLLFPPGFEETPATTSLVRCLQEEVASALGEHATMTGTA
jgi:DNA-binding transcriptional LysR family regulator